MSTNHRHCVSPIVLLAAACAFMAATPGAGAGEGTPTAAPAPAATPVPGSLAAAAQKIKLKKPENGDKSIVITNENIGEYAAKGSLTYASGSATGSAAGVAPGQDGVPGQLSEKDKKNKRDYWRNRYKEQLKRIEQMKKRLADLNREIPGLWTQFYSWDDPAYRDGVIKPKLDRDLQEAKELQKKIPEEEAKLDQIREQARRDGALPGWFRGL